MTGIWATVLPSPPAPGWNWALDQHVSPSMCYPRGPSGLDPTYGGGRPTTRPIRAQKGLRTQERAHQVEEETKNTHRLVHRHARVHTQTGHTGTCVHTCTDTNTQARYVYIQEQRHPQRHSLVCTCMTYVRTHSHTDTHHTQGQTCSSFRSPVLSISSCTHLCPSPLGSHYSLWTDKCEDTRGPSKTCKDA